MVHTQSQEAAPSSLTVNGDHKERQYHSGSSTSTSTSTSVVEGSTSKHQKDSNADSLSSSAEVCRVPTCSPFYYSSSCV